MLTTNGYLFVALYEDPLLNETKGHHFPHGPQLSHGQLIQKWQLVADRAGTHRATPALAALRRELIAVSGRFIQP